MDMFFILLKNLDWYVPSFAKNAALLSALKTLVYILFMFNVRLARNLNVIWGAVMDP